MLREALRYLCRHPPTPISGAASNSGAGSIFGTGSIFGMSSIFDAGSIYGAASVPGAGGGWGPTGVAAASGFARRNDERRASRRGGGKGGGGGGGLAGRIGAVAVPPPRARVAGGAGAELTEILAVDCEMVGVGRSGEWKGHRGGFGGGEWVRGLAGAFRLEGERGTGAMAGVGRSGERKGWSDGLGGGWVVS